MRFLTLCFVAFYGCSGDPAAPPAVLKEIDAHVLRNDSGAVSDAGVDGSPDDSSIALPKTDAQVINPDPCGAAENIDRCATGCDEGFHCVPDLCDGSACVPGRPCQDGSDCPSGVCISQNDREGICQAELETCGSSKGCPLGFWCEEGSCIDRRVPCSITFFGCPRGFMCTVVSFSGRSFCVPNHVRCMRSEQCELGMDCIDIDGDGKRECAPPGVCTSNSDCEGLNEGCSVNPSISLSECSMDGPCGNGECSEQRECVDITGGEAAPHCIVREGECRVNSECPTQQICASPSIDERPRCLGVEGSHDA